MRGMSAPHPSAETLTAGPVVPDLPPRWRVLGILSLLLGFASISTDLYLPALPAMTRALAATPGQLELTISTYLAGFSLGQLVWGPLGDRFGRRAPVVAGLVLFMVGSAGCALAGSATALVGWRILQALGACSGVVLGRAMVRDLYPGSGGARMLSVLMTVMAVAPLIGPTVGGQILLHAAWPAIFWTLVGVGALTAVSVLAWPETLPSAGRKPEPLASAVANYRRLASDRAVLGYAGAGFFFYAGVFAYVAGTPFAYIAYHHVTPQLYGLLFASGIVGIMAANLLSARLVGTFGGDRLLNYGAALAAASGAVVLATSRFDWGGLAGLAVPLLFFNAATGLIIANSTAGAMSRFPDRAGAVSALVGALQYGGGMAGSALVSALADGTPASLGLVVGLCGVASLVCVWLVLPSRGGTEA